MTIRKILLATGAVALMSAPAALAHPGHPPAGTANEHATSHGKHGSNGPATDKKGSNPGQSHRCTPHSAGYVASGTLVSDTLTKNADGSYSGEVVVEVTHTNHHALADKGKTVAYTLTDARLTLAVSDTNKDGTVGTDDLVKGDRTHVTGRIATLRHNCSQSGFKATTTVRHVVFHDPQPAVSKA